MQYIPCTFILCIHVADVVDMMWNMLDTVYYAYIVHVLIHIIFVYGEDTYRGRTHTHSCI